MKLFKVFYCILILYSGNLNAQISVSTNEFLDYNNWFTNQTMRVDYFHTGNSSEEMFAIDEVKNDGAWAGSKTVLIDDLNLGLYFFEVFDIETSTLMYSRGFASIFGEWQTTPDATKQNGTFHETIRFPWPKYNVRLVLKKRNANNEFQLVWSSEIDPAYRQVIPVEAKHNEKVLIIEENGLPADKLDIVVLGDGYSTSEMEKFERDAKRMAKALLETEPFASQRYKINIRAVETPALQSGITKPHHNIYKKSPLGVHYSAFDSERYALSYENKTIRDVASAVPYDCMVILMNERTYGGGGIYKLYTTVAADNSFSEYIMVHEFGHHLAALADEYYTSSVAYEVPSEIKEPWETNITALLDPMNIKWKELMNEEIPLPTPWNKETFDEFGYKNQIKRDSLRAIHSSEEVMEAFFNHQHNIEDEFFSIEKYKNNVGAFEGGGYSAKGIYRSQLDCIMFTRHMQFCKVCQNSIIQVINQYSK